MSRPKWGGALAVVIGALGCGSPNDQPDASLVQQSLTAPSTTPSKLSHTEAVDLATSALLPGEELVAAEPMSLHGLGKTVVIGVAMDDDEPRTFAIDTTGAELPYDGLRELNRTLYAQKFGKMAVPLFEAQQALGDQELIDVELIVAGDFLEPELPFDGTDQAISADDFQAWVAEHRTAQRGRVGEAKSELLQFLDDGGAIVLANHSGLPILRARMTAEFLRSESLNTRDDIIAIHEVDDQPGALLGYAGLKSMNDGALSGAQCGTGKCDGASFWVGLWESSGGTTNAGIAMTNTRLGNFVKYYDALDTCTIPGDCTGAADNAQRCAGGVCVAEHVTWVAGSLGMSGTYQYPDPDNWTDVCTTPPDTSDPDPNAPANTSISSSGAYNISYAHANDGAVAGFNWLVDDEHVVHVNRSQSGLVSDKAAAVNWAARYDGVFFTQAGGNDGDGAHECQRLWNGLCVGYYRYATYNDLSTHRHAVESSWINDDTVTTPVLERPHVLGPGRHKDGASLGGLYLPSIEQGSCSSFKTMRTEAFDGSPIAGSSFAAPAVLGAALQAHEYEGWFSALAFPQVLKAVLLAGTVDANADGAVGTGSVWNSTQDFKDGAGQIDLNLVKQILDNNRYTYRNLYDSSFSSCGTNCREYTVTTITVPAFKSLKIALAWHSCQDNEYSSPFLNNDLDLRINRPGTCFMQYRSSVAINSETEMIYEPCLSGYPSSDSVTIKIRIKNGASLNPCNSTTYERVGLAWSFQ